MRTIILKKGKEESLKRFHPWVFSGAIWRVDGGRPEEGGVVRVVDAEGNCLGRGHFQIGSISVRMLTFEDQNIDRDFWKSRLREAFSLRKALGLVVPGRNEAFRLVHGEGDRLPGLVVDVYGRTAVMQAHSVGMHLSREVIAKALVEVVSEVSDAPHGHSDLKGFTSGWIENVFYKSETTLPAKAVLGQENGYLIGGRGGEIALENGLRFHIDWREGQKTGFFVDQRENRSLVESYAKGRRVLNMFCYTGGFSVYALRGGAERVCSVDSSARAIELTKENVFLNFGETQRHEACVEDAFKYLERMGGEYDLIVLDPPAFAKRISALRNALRGYSKLNAAALRKIRPGGLLFTFSCSQAVNKDSFRLAVFTAAAQTGRHVRILHQLHQPSDHPINIFHPEGEYLKGLVLEVE